MEKWNYNNVRCASDHYLFQYNYKGIQWYNGNSASAVAMAMLYI